MWSFAISFIQKHGLKSTLAALVILCIILSLIVENRGSVITDLNNRIIALEAKANLDLALYQSQYNQAKATIEKQNTAIEQYEINLITYQQTVSNKEKELQAARYTLQEQVNKKLVKDSSAENQIKIMTSILKDFSDEAN